MDCFRGRELYNWVRLGFFKFWQRMHSMAWRFGTVRVELGLQGLRLEDPVMDERLD